MEFEITLEGKMNQAFAISDSLAMKKDDANSWAGYCK